MRRLLPLIVLFLTSGIIAQTALPDKGSVSDLTGKTKAYLTSDTLNGKLIAKEIQKKKTVTLVEKADEADFVIEYKQLSSEPIGTLGMAIITGQMDVYFYRDGRRVVAWTDSSIKSASYPSIALINRFLKDLSKLK